MKIEIEIHDKLVPFFEAQAEALKITLPELLAAKITWQDHSVVAKSGIPIAPSEEHLAGLEAMRVATQHAAEGASISLNGHIVAGVKPTISYGELLVLAGFPPHRILTVTYSNAGQGTLSPGQSVAVRDGMIFNVADTSNA